MPPQHIHTLPDLLNQIYGKKQNNPVSNVDPLDSMPMQTTDEPRRPIENNLEPRSRLSTSMDTGSKKCKKDISEPMKKEELASAHHSGNLWLASSEGHGDTPPGDHTSNVKQEEGDLSNVNDHPEIFHYDGCNDPFLTQPPLSAADIAPPYPAEQHHQHQAGDNVSQGPSS